MEKTEILWGSAKAIYNPRNQSLIVTGGTIKNSKDHHYISDYKKIKRENIKDIIFTGKVIIPNDASLLFENLSNITILDLTNVNLDNTENINDMIKGCSKLKTLIIKDVNNNKIQNINNFCYHLNNLESLYLENIHLDQLVSISNTFKDLPALKYIYAKNITIKNEKITNEVLDSIIK